jgi:hypothetical protein
MFPGPPLSADGSSASEGLEVLPLEDRKFWPRGLQWATAAQNLHLQNSCSEGMGPHLAGPLIPWNLWNSHRLAGRLGSHPMDHCLVWPSGPSPQTYRQHRSWPHFSGWSINPT